MTVISRSMRKEELELHCWQEFHWYDSPGPKYLQCPPSPLNNSTSSSTFSNQLEGQDLYLEDLQETFKTPSISRLKVCL